VKMTAETLPGKANTESATWQLLPNILILAFSARATCALTTQYVTHYITHPDEIFQYLEQAHRLVFGHGIVPWEYQYGVRSWIIPGFVALILKLLAVSGLDRPDIYQPTVKLVFCAISLSLPLSVYKIAQAILDEGAARLALMATAFWYQLIYFSPSPMPDALATYALFGALVWLFRRPTRGSTLAFGALAGLTLALRFQLAPMVGVAMLLAALRWRWRGWPALVGFLLVIASAGALDAYTWGRGFNSVISNVELNLIAGFAERFGTAPSYYYLLKLVTDSGGIACLGALGLALSWRQTWPLSVIGLAELVALSAVGHKEARFIIPLTPIYLTGIAALFARGQQLQGTTMPAIASVVPLARRIVAILPAATFRIAALFARDRQPVRMIMAITSYAPLRHIVVVLAAATFGVLVGLKTEQQHDDSDDVRQAYLMLSRRTDVRGVIDDSGVAWDKLGGYYDLHQTAAIYRPDLPMTNITRVRQSPQLFASHWLTRADVAAPEGYVFLAQNGRIAIWRRSTDPPETLIAPGYSEYAPPPLE
jgi:hypothetical protein